MGHVGNGVARLSHTAWLFRGGWEGTQDSLRVGSRLCKKRENSRKGSSFFSQRSMQYCHFYWQSYPMGRKDPIVCSCCFFACPQSSGRDKAQNVIGQGGGSCIFYCQRLAGFAKRAYFRRCRCPVAPLVAPVLSVPLSRLSGRDVLQWSAAYSYLFFCWCWWCDRGRESGSRGRAASCRGRDGGWI